MSAEAPPWRTDRRRLGPSATALMESGVYGIHDANAFFIDSVRVLNRLYTRLLVSLSSHYFHFFPSASSGNNAPRKRKRCEEEKKKLQHLFLRNYIADQRHLEARLVLLKAHERCLVLISCWRNLRNGAEKCNDESVSLENELDFVELLWQAPLCEIILDDKDLQNS